MLSVQRRGQKKVPSRSRSHENSFDYSGSDNEEYEKLIFKKEAGSDKSKKIKTKGFKPDDRSAKKIILKQSKRDSDSDFPDDDKPYKEPGFNGDERGGKALKEKRKKHKYGLRTFSEQQLSAKRIKLDDEDDALEYVIGDNDGSLHDLERGPIPHSKVPKRNKVIVVHEESDASDSDIDPKDVLADHDYAVRGSKKEIWVGRVTRVDDEGFDVQWFEELRAYPGNYALLPWYGRVPKSSIIKELKMECSLSTGMWKLETELPAFKVYQK